MKSISIFTKENADSQCSLLHECSAWPSTINPATLTSSQPQEIRVNIQDAGQQPFQKTWIKATRFEAGAAKADTAILIEDTSRTASAKLPVLEGRVFSTLALPLPKTLLQVHINGPFMMSSDRRTFRAGEGAESEVKLFDFCANQMQQRLPHTRHCVLLYQWVPQDLVVNAVLSRILASIGSAAVGPA